MRIVVKLKAQDGTILAQTTPDAYKIGGAEVTPAQFTLVYNWSAFGAYDSATTPTTWEFTAEEGGYLTSPVYFNFPALSDTGNAMQRLISLSEPGLDAGRIAVGETISFAITGAFSARSSGMAAPASLAPAVVEFYAAPVVPLPTPVPLDAGGIYAGGEVCIRWDNDRLGWKNERIVSLGEVGDRFPVYRLLRLGLYRTRQWEFSCSSPLQFCLVSAEEDAEVFR